MQNLNQVNHHQAASGDRVVNHNSTDNLYDRFNSKGQEGLSAKFASVLSSLKAQFGSSGDHKGAFKAIDNMMASNKKSLDAFNELKDEKLDEEDKRKKSANKHALDNERIHAFNQEAMELQSIANMEVANHQAAHEASVLQDNASKAARPSDILAASLGSSSSRSSQGIAASAANITATDAATLGSSGSGALNSNLTGDHSGSGSSATSGITGYGTDELSDSAKAAKQMVQLDNIETDVEIGDNLNKMNRSNLGSVNSTQQELDAATKIANYNNNELRQNLDVLARDSNVSKLSLQMTNPQVIAAKRADAKALANLPTSQDTLKGLAATQEAKGNLLSSLSGSAQLQAGGQVATGKVSGGAINQVASPRVGAIGEQGASAQSSLLKSAQQQSHGSESLGSRQSIAHMGVRASASKASDQAASNSANTVKNQAQSTKDAGALLNGSSKSSLEAAVNNASSSKANNAQEALMRLAQEQTDSLKITSAQNALLADEYLDPKASEGELGAALASLKQGFKGLSGSNSTTNYSHSSLYASMFDKSASVPELSDEATMAFEDEDNAEEQGAFGAALSASAQQVQSKESASSAPLNHFAPSGNETQDANELHERVMQMAARNLKQLAVELSPNELGKMKISISLSEDNEAVSVSLAAANPQTREILAKALPKLREILSSQHIATEASVSDLDINADEGNVIASEQEQVALSAITQSSAAKRSQVSVAASSMDEVSVESLLKNSRTLNSMAAPEIEPLDNNSATQTLEAFAKGRA